MPVHRTIDGGYQWGSHGKVYHGAGAEQRAEAQGRAAFANGYKGDRVKKLSSRLKQKGYARK